MIGGNARWGMVFAGALLAMQGCEVSYNDATKQDNTAASRPASAAASAPAPAAADANADVNSTASATPADAAGAAADAAPNMTANATPNDMADATADSTSNPSATTTPEPPAEPSVAAAAQSLGDDAATNVMGAAPGPASALQPAADTLAAGTAAPTELGRFLQENPPMAKGEQKAAQGGGTHASQAKRGDRKGGA